MKFGRVLVAFAFTFNMLLSTAVEARGSINQIQSDAPRSKSGLLANCPETSFETAPLEPRPVIGRATFASRPVAPRHRPTKRRATDAHRPMHAVHRGAHPRLGVKHVVKHGAVHHRATHARRPVSATKGVSHARRPVPHRGTGATHRPLLRRVTYASPLCGERSRDINNLLGLEDIASADTQDAVNASETVPDDLQNAIFGPPTPAVIGGGTNGGPTTPPIIIFPGNPTLPGNPGSPGTPTNPGVPPVVIAPPGTPGTPGVPATPTLPGTPVIPPVGPGTPDNPPTGPTPPPVTPGPPIPPIFPNPPNPGGPNPPPPVVPPAQPVPEPATWAMMIMGMAFVGMTMRRRRPVSFGPMNQQQIG